MPDRETLAVIDDLDKKLGVVEGEKAGNFIFSKKIIDAILLKKSQGCEGFLKKHLQYRVVE